MSVINNFPAMPNRFAVVCEYLHFLGEEGDSLETVEKQLSPLRSADAQEEGVDDGSPRTSMADAVLLEMEKLKLLTRSEERISLHPEIRELAPKDNDWQMALRPHLFSRMVFPEVAPSFGQAEFPDALSWFLAQDPMEPLPWQGTQHAERIMKQLGENDPLNAIRNNSRYQNLVYWSRYLGFAERLSLQGADLVVPDPTEAITACIPFIFREGKEMPIQTFMQRLSEACPVMDGGVARRELEVRLTPQLQLKDRHLSRSTSLSLLRLQKRGVLVFKAVSDAPAFVLDLGGETSPVSHISFQGGRDV